MGSCIGRGKTISSSSLHPANGKRNNYLNESARRADFVLAPKPPWRRRFLFFTNGDCRGVEMILESPNNWQQNQRESSGARALRVGGAASSSVGIGTVIGTVECANQIRSRNSRN
jgi:hypothetical protein